MLPHIPTGFIDLVEKVKVDRPLVLPEAVSDDEMWDSFCYCALFGPDRIEAETSYAHDLLKENELFSRKTLKKDGWINKAEDILKKELEKVKEPAKCRKIAVINKVLARICNLRETLAKADEVFSSLDIKPITLKEAEKERDAREREVLEAIIKGRDSHKAKKKRSIGEILASLVYAPKAIENPNKIPDVGYTKAVLWLHSCGVGRDYAPDNNHTRRFLNECGYNASEWGGDSYVSKDYDVLMSYFRNVANEVNKKSGDEYCVAEVSHAVFFYESTKSLIGRRKYKRYYDPATMLSFLENKEWDINDLTEWLVDIQNVDALREELEEFISKTFRI